MDGTITKTEFDIWAMSQPSAKEQILWGTRPGEMEMLITEQWHTFDADKRAQCLAWCKEQGFTETRIQDFDPTAMPDFASTVKD